MRNVSASCLRRRRSCSIGLDIRRSEKSSPYGTARPKQPSENAAAQRPVGNQREEDVCLRMDLDAIANQ